MRRHRETTNMKALAHGGASRCRTASGGAAVGLVNLASESGRSSGQWPGGGRRFGSPAHRTTAVWPVPRSPTRARHGRCHLGRHGASREHQVGLGRDAQLNHGRRRMTDGHPHIVGANGNDSGSTTRSDETNPRGLWTSCPVQTLSGHGFRSTEERASRSPGRPVLPGAP